MESARVAQFPSSASNHCTHGEIPPDFNLGDFLFDLQKLHFKNQCRVGRDCSSCTFRSVAERWRNAQLALAADLHSCDAFVPAFDHLTLAQRELEGFVTIHRAVE